ncbi:HepT-like ribonuclease domain-containing protein [Pedobacter sp.]|uniref:HepT-like ribonuclease domain-containing protein n=1 Tax=Pedobacter sp. TaxID=1411316 RepID=UPI003D7FC801
MKGKLGDKVRLQHILDSINEIEGYLSNVTVEQFLANSEKHFATIKQIKIVGEASNALTEELKSLNPEIPWRSIESFRNSSIHEYFGLNLQLVWGIAKNDLPDLKVKIQNLLKSL